MAVSFSQVLITYRLLYHKPEGKANQGFMVILLSTSPPLSPSGRTPQGEPLSFEGEGELEKEGLSPLLDTL